MYMYIYIYIYVLNQHKLDELSNCIPPTPPLGRSTANPSCRPPGASTSTTTTTTNNNHNNNNNNNNNTNRPPGACPPGRTAEGRQRPQKCTII